MSHTPEEIGQLAATHAFSRHGSEFMDPTRGGTVQVHSVADLAAHVSSVLSDPETLTFRAPARQPWRLADYYYHVATNTMVTVPEDPVHAPTAYRPKTGKAEFEKKRSEMKSIDGQRPAVRRLGTSPDRGPDRAASRDRDVPSRAPSRATGGRSPSAGRSPPRG